jgi:hypothetical protein
MIVPVGALILFLAEGFEIAVVSLLDKDPRSITNEQLRRYLETLHDNSEFFIAQREGLVLAIISFVTLLTDFDYIYVPWMGPLYGLWADVFALLFTSLNLLWFAQNLPKRWALLDPERFLRWSTYKLGKSLSLWDAILALSRIDLPALSELPLQLVRRRSSTVLSLPPRPSTYYQTSLLRRRAGWHRMCVEISHEQDDWLTITARALFLTLPTYFRTRDGRLGMFTQEFLLPCPTPGWEKGILERQPILSPDESPMGTEESVFRSTPKLTVLKAYTGYQLSEETFQEGFDMLFRGDACAGVREETDPWSWDVSDTGFRWQVHAGPADVVGGKEQPLTVHGLFTAVLYTTEAVTQSKRGGESGGWSITFDLPCRSLSVILRPSLGHVIVNPICVASFSSVSSYGLAPPPPEGMHGEVQPNGTGIYTLEYPETGSTYSFQWDNSPANS